MYVFKKMLYLTKYTILPHEQPPQSDVCAGGHSVLATIRTRLNPKHSYTDLHAAT